MINCIGGVQVLFPLLELVTSDNNNDAPLSPTTGKDSSDLIISGGTTGTPGSPVSMVDGKIDEEWEVLPSSSYSGKSLYLLGKDPFL